MKLYRKIDTITGNFIEDVLFETHPIVMEQSIWESTDEFGNITPHVEWIPVLDTEGNTQLDPHYIEEAPPQGFYWPKWNGTEWVECGVAPEPTPPVPTEVERIEAVEEVLDFLLMGGM